ncbi:MAG: transcriptional regulator NrdR [Desulfobacterales bacterium]|nr:transcriptional regulator NrdR [Desulfobacterales bacterium]
MQCPFCNADDDKVIDSRSSEDGRAIRRRRQCNACGRRFTTYERVEETIKLTVIKRDGSRMPYTRPKLVRGIEQACYKRPVSADQVQAVVDSIEEELHKRFDREVQTQDIGEIVCERLGRLDRVAYVRFASIYKQFSDIDDVLKEVRDVMSRPKEFPDQGKLF